MDKQTKKDLLDLFKQMLDKDFMSGHLANTKPEENGYKIEQYTITITKETKEL